MRKEAVILIAFEDPRDLWEKGQPEGKCSLAHTMIRSLAEALQKQLTVAGIPHPVYVGYPHWHPSLEETLRQMRAEGVRSAIALIATPFVGPINTGRYVQAVEVVRRRLRDEAPSLRYVEPWNDHPLFIEALTDRASQALNGMPQTRRKQCACLFVARGMDIPRTSRSLYIGQLMATSVRVAERLGFRKWTLAYVQGESHSQASPLGPGVSEAIRSHVSQGIRDVIVVPIGFIADQMDALYALDAQVQAAAQEMRVRILRAGAIGLHPALVEMMTELVRNSDYSLYASED